MNRSRNGRGAVRRLAAVALAAFVAGCGGSGGDAEDGDAPSDADVAGTWYEEPGGLSCSFAELGDVPVTASFGVFDFGVVVVAGGAVAGGTAPRGSALRRAGPGSGSRLHAAGAHGTCRPLPTTA